MEQACLIVLVRSLVALNYVLGLAATGISCKKQKSGDDGGLGSAESSPRETDHSTTNASHPRGYGKCRPGVR